MFRNRCRRLQAVKYLIWARLSTVVEHPLHCKVPMAECKGRAELQGSVSLMISRGAVCKLYLSAYCAHGQENPSCTVRAAVCWWGIFQQWSSLKCFKSYVLLLFPCTAAQHRVCMVLYYQQIDYSTNSKYFCTSVWSIIYSSIFLCIYMNL